MFRAPTHFKTLAIISLSSIICMLLTVFSIHGPYIAFSTQTSSLMSFTCSSSISTPTFSLFWPEILYHMRTLDTGSYSCISSHLFLTDFNWLYFSRIRLNKKVDNGLACLGPLPNFNYFTE